MTWLKNGILRSGALGVLAGFVFAVGLVSLLSLPAGAQTANPAPTYSGDFQRPYGWSYGQEAQPFDANTRDANGNRVVLDGRMMTGADQSTLSTSSGASAWAQASAGAGFSQGTAVGNQVNVITQGNYNTVVVTTTQTNTGNQTVLNGRLNLQ